MKVFRLCWNFRKDQTTLFSNLPILEKHSVLLENSFKNYAQDRSGDRSRFSYAGNAPPFPAGDRSDPKFKIKNCARDCSDIKFQCSKCLRLMFLPLISQLYSKKCR